MPPHKKRPPIVVIDGEYGNPWADRDVLIGHVVEWQDMLPAQEPNNELPGEAESPGPVPFAIQCFDCGFEWTWDNESIPPCPKCGSVDVLDPVTSDLNPVPLREEVERKARPEFDYEHKRLWHDGHWDSLKEGEANLFKVLFDKNGGWVNLALLPSNAAHIKLRMKPCLKALIESNRHDGYRIPSLLQ